MIINTTSFSEEEKARTISLALLSTDEAMVLDDEIEMVYINLDQDINDGFIYTFINSEMHYSSRINKQNNVIVPVLELNEGRLNENSMYHMIAVAGDITGANDRLEFPFVYKPLLQNESMAFRFENDSFSLVSLNEETEFLRVEKYHILNGRPGRVTRIKERGLNDPSNDGVDSWGNDIIKRLELSEFIEEIDALVFQSKSRLEVVLFEGAIPPVINGMDILTNPSLLNSPMLKFYVPDEYYQDYVDAWSEIDKMIFRVSEL